MDFSFFEGELLAEGSSICLYNNVDFTVYNIKCDWDTLMTPLEGHSDNLFHDMYPMDGIHLILNHLGPMSICGIATLVVRTGIF